MQFIFKTLNLVNDHNYLVLTALIKWKLKTHLCVYLNNNYSHNYECLWLCKVCGGGFPHFYLFLPPIFSAQFFFWNSCSLTAFSQSASLIKLISRGATEGRKICSFFLPRRFTMEILLSTQDCVLISPVVLPFKSGPFVVSQILM